MRSPMALLPVGPPAKDRGQGQVRAEEGTGPVLRGDVTRRALDQLAVRGEVADLLDHIEDPRGVRPRVHPQGTADAARDALQELQARQGVASRRVGQLLQPGTGASPQAVARHGDADKGGLSQAHHDAPGCRRRG
ncbi:MAG: hypothetical protein M5U12_28175 [Verrucomicrobia bacterium]|nr:hypothetical protein [Verrucomicrobiota bacterium]